MDVGDGVLAPCGPRQCAAAPPIPTVAHEPGLDAPVLGPPAHDCDISPLYRVGAKLPAEISFRLDRSREHQQATRLLVEAVNRPACRRSPGLPFCKQTR